MYCGVVDGCRSKMSRDDMMQWLGLEKQRLFGGALVCFAIAAGILGFSITRYDNMEGGNEGLLVCASGKIP